MKKQIDIIIPVYKSEKTLPKLLDSISMQSISDLLNITIVIDGDGLDYRDIVNHYRKYLAINVVHYTENRGPGYARQMGLQSTYCPYVAFCDSDDALFGPFAMETLLQTAESSGTCCLVCGQHYLEIRSNEKLDFLLHKANLVWVFAKLYRRSFLDQHGIRFNDSRANEDVGFNKWIYLVAMKPEEKVISLELPVYSWHQNPNSITKITEDFAFTGNIVGFADNTIYAIEHAKAANLQNKHYIQEEIIKTMALLYTFYMETCYNKPEYGDLNLQACAKFYEKEYEMLELTLDSEFLNGCILKQLKASAATLLEKIPHLTFFQFMEKVRSLNNEKN